MSDCLIELRDVRFAYHLEPVLDHLDWCCRAGENWAILGGNGSGKTTLARLICDDIRPQRGEVRRAVDARDVAHISFDLQRQMMERDRRFDDSEVREDAFDVGTTVRAAILQGRPPDRRFTALCRRLRVEHILERGIRFISTGESRKTLIARALMAEPALLILDNPLEGLDHDARRDMRALLDELVASPVPLVLLVKDRADIPESIDRVLTLDGPAPSAIGTELPPSAAPEPAPGVPLLRLRGVDVSFRGTPVLSDIHWTLMPGQHACIRGPNGAGKSTLLGLLCGDNDKAYGQDVALFGRRRGSGESVWDIKARFGVVSTALQLTHLKRLRVAEVVASGWFDSIGLYDDCSDEQRRAVDRWLQALGLWPKRRERYAELSFGEQRLALLARAMVKSPSILILDEPCIGLDPRQRRRILDFIDAIAGGGRTHVLYVSHDPQEMPSCINRILELVPAPGGGYTAVCRTA